ncbi:hypothetical protein DC522_05995 [Microvirga sp. KLBC 81]|nr:hypothetical protein DC522_05995 [Microvirga sp. KLBC 81]
MQQLWKTDINGTVVMRESSIVAMDRAAALTCVSFSRHPSISMNRESRGSGARDGKNIRLAGYRSQWCPSAIALWMPETVRRECPILARLALDIAGLVLDWLLSVRAHGIYLDLVDASGRSCCDRTDRRPAFYRVTQS